jgi:hypothetical protein
MDGKTLLRSLALLVCHRPVTIWVFFNITLSSSVNYPLGHLLSTGNCTDISLSSNKGGWQCCEYVCNPRNDTTVCTPLLHGKKGTAGRILRDWLSQDFVSLVPSFWFSEEQEFCIRPTKHSYSPARRNTSMTHFLGAIFVKRHFTEKKRA